MKIKDLIDWMIMPQTIEPQGLIHKPGRGPNNRFDFKNKGNNKANEYFSGPRTLGEPGYGTAHPLHPSNVKSLSDKFKEKYKSLFKKKSEPKREWTDFELACMEGGHPLPEDTVNEKCWDGYKQVGMKNKGGRQVPNCVPEDAAGVGIITKQNTTKDVKPGDEYKNVKKLHLEWQQFKENTGIDWNALRQAGVVMPMAYYVPSNPVKPNVKQPNIITAYNLEKEKLGPGERLTPFTDQQVTPQFWQQYMDREWPRLQPFKKDQIRQSAKMKGVQFNENFADGKKKGKSRPGRVKRAGASCKGSVSSLRSKAKKYGGERGKMYHWCANMKSGRKKSK